MSAAINEVYLLNQGCNDGRTYLLLLHTQREPFQRRVLNLKHAGIKAIVVLSTDSSVSATRKVYICSASFWHASAALAAAGEARQEPKAGVKQIMKLIVYMQP